MSAEEALVAAIVGADAAVYAYGVLGVHLGGAEQRQAQRALAAHRAARARWQQQTSPVAIPAAFDLPQAVTDAAGARTLAALVERRLTAVYADLAAALTGNQRADAVSEAMACQTRAVRWGAPTQAFPHA